MIAGLYAELWIDSQRTYISYIYHQQSISQVFSQQLEGFANLNLDCLAREAHAFCDLFIGQSLFPTQER